MELTAAYLALFITGTVSAYMTEDKFGESKFGVITVRNDVWGSNSGKQVLTADSGSKWCVNCNHGSSGGIKSYPHSGFPVNKPLSAVKSLTSNFAVRVDKTPGTLAYSVTYDIWLQNKAYELMIWMNKCGQVGPIGAQCADNVKLGAHTFTVSKGSNGSNMVFSFINKNPTDSGTVDIKAILDYICTQKWFKEQQAVMLEEVQFGFEITSTPPGTNFCVTNFDCKLT